MKFQFREVTHSDLNKFPIWYERIDGPELFSNFIPTTFKTFEDSSVTLWFIIMDDEDEIGTIWFEKKKPDKLEIDLGIYLNRADLFGKGIGRTLIKYAIDTFLSKNDATICLKSTLRIFIMEHFMQIMMARLSMKMKGGLTSQWS